jgi:hypothetical protein
MPKQIQLEIPKTSKALAKIVSKHKELPGREFWLTH